PSSPQSNLGPDPRGEAIVIRTILAFVCLVAVLVGAPMLVRAADPPLIRFGHGFAAEEQAWLMAARPDLTPGQGTRYRRKPSRSRATRSASRPTSRTSSTGAPRPGSP